MLSSFPVLVLTQNSRKGKQPTAALAQEHRAPFSKVTHDFPQSERLSVSIVQQFNCANMQLPSLGTFVIPTASQMWGKK